MTRTLNSSSTINSASKSNEASNHRGHLTDFPQRQIRRCRVTLASEHEMKRRIARSIFALVLVTIVASCTHSRLDPIQVDTSATLGVFLPNVRPPVDDLVVSKELLSQLLPLLAQAKHLDRRGSPSPRMTYVLTIKQADTVEGFYFFDDFTPCSFPLAPAQKRP